jgi:predicted TIM-barrel fold metal-dependent hydrolase
LSEIEALAAANGCGHLVLVQPSVYGTDNSLLLAALARTPGRHRGVVVLRGDEGAAQLDAMHAAGVRGVRFNLVSPVGSAREDAARLLQQLAPALRERGWHVQWYVAAGVLPLLARLQAECGLPFVLDHLAGLTPAAADDNAWTALAQLAKAGAWIKLSGWYRLQAEPPYGALDPLLQRAATLFDEHMVWGSDWPHTSFPPDALPGYDTLLCPLVRVLGEQAARGVRLAGGSLYS